MRLAEDQVELQDLSLIAVLPFLCSRRTGLSVVKWPRSFRKIRSRFCGLGTRTLCKRRSVELAEVAAAGGARVVGAEPLAHVVQVSAVGAAPAPDVQAAHRQVAQRARVGQLLALVAHPSRALQPLPAHPAVGAVVGRTVRQSLDATVRTQLDHLSQKIDRSISKSLFRRGHTFK